MRIGLDARSLFAPERRGIARTLFSLYQALHEVRPDWQVIAYHRHEEPVAEQLPPGAVGRQIEMPGDRFDAWLNWRLPLAAWRDDVDVLHCPGNDCPAISGVPLAVTIHDVIPLETPGSCTRAQVRHFSRSLRHARKRGEAVICPSQYTADRLVRRYRFAPGQCHVVPWAGPNGAYGFEPRSEATWRRYGLSRPYVIHFGAADVRKNTHRLLQAWSHMPRKLLKRWQLLVVGLNGEIYDDLRQWVKKRALGDYIILHRYVPADDLPGLLRRAGLLAYPSLSEGFGMPILEAFAARTPVLAGNTTALPEVAGYAARLVDPRDADAITDAMADLLEHPAKRKKMISQGERRREHFNWSRSAEMLAHCLESVAERRRKAAA